MTHSILFLMVHFLKAFESLTKKGQMKGLKKVCLHDTNHHHLVTSVFNVDV